MSLVCELVCVYLLGNFGGKIRKFFIPSSGHTGSSDDEGGLVVIYIIRQIILFDRFYLSVRSRLLRRRLKANFRWHIKVLNWRVAGKPKSKQARPVQTITIICAPKKINDGYNKKASYKAAKYFPQGKKMKIITEFRREKRRCANDQFHLNILKIVIWWKWSYGDGGINLIKFFPNAVLVHWRLETSFF